MIAMNYIKHPEALRFQCEMFSNGYHNSPRIMRLMQCIFDQRPDVPQWFKEMRAKAKSLVNAWKSKMVEMFDIVKKTAKKVDPRQLELMLFPAAEPKKYWLENGSTATETVFPPAGYIGSYRWNINLKIKTADWSWGDKSAAWFENDTDGSYQNFCRKKTGFQGWAKRVGHRWAYSNEISSRRVDGSSHLDE